MSPSRPRPRPKRRYPRLTLRVEVVLELEGREIEALATTLGAGGLFVANADALPVGAPLVARFRLPGELGLLRLAARVVWRAARDTDPGSRGFGIEFVDPDARAKLAAELESWAQRRESDPEPDRF